jgi:hypothetical protein
MAWTTSRSGYSESSHDDSVQAQQQRVRAGGSSDSYLGRLNESMTTTVAATAITGQQLKQ